MTPFEHLRYLINNLPETSVIQVELRAETLFVLGHDTDHDLYLITTVKINDPYENYANIVAYEKQLVAIEAWEACLAGDPE